MEEHKTDRWKLRMVEKARRGDPITHFFPNRGDARWLMDMLRKEKIRYRDFDVGNMRIISTEYEHCPCCKQDYPINVK